MAETLAVQLERVQSAVAAIEGGMQSYTVGGNSFTKADLKLLYDPGETRSSQRIVRVARGGGFRMQRWWSEFGEKFGRDCR